MRTYFIFAALFLIFFFIAAVTLAAQRRRWHGAAGCTFQNFPDFPPPSAGLMLFESTLFYPAHAPDLDIMEAWGRQGWTVAAAVVTPPETEHSVAGLLVIWKKAAP